MLTYDVVFVNRYAFMVTSARNIRSLIVEHIPIQTDDQISKILNKVIKLYGRFGFIIRVIMMDVEFDKVAETLGNFEVKFSASREHVGELDRTIRNVNDFWRVIFNTLS